MKSRSKTPEKSVRKPPANVKGEVIRLRVTESLKTIATDAAAIDGRDISSWLRWLIIQRAQDLGIQGALAYRIEEP